MITKRSEPRLPVILLLLVSVIGVWSFNASLKPRAGQQGVAYISYERILRGSTLLAQENKRKDNLFALAKQSSADIQKKYRAMPASLRREMKIIDDMSKNAQIRAEQGRLRRISLHIISDAVEKYRIKNHYSVVFNKDTASVSKPGHDISNDIIDELAHVKVEYGAPPQFEDATRGLLKAYPVSAG